MILAAGGLLTLVVYGAVDPSALADGLGAESVANPRGAEGQATSLRALEVAEVACPGMPVDVDTREDLRRWA